MVLGGKRQKRERTEGGSWTRKYVYLLLFVKGERRVRGVDSGRIVCSQGKGSVGYLLCWKGRGRK